MKRGNVWLLLLAGMVIGIFFLLGPALEFIGVLGDESLRTVPDGNFVIVNDETIIRDADDNQIAVVDTGNYPLEGILGNTYAITYQGETAYIFTDEPNIALTRPEQVLFGAYLSVRYLVGSGFRPDIPRVLGVTNIEENDDEFTSRYRVYVVVRDGEREFCDYTLRDGFRTQENTLTYRQVDIDIRIEDGLTDTTLAETILDIDLPRCPIRYQFRMGEDGRFVDEVEYFAPSGDSVHGWIVNVLESITSTPTPLPSPRFNIEDLPATPADMTPVFEGNMLVVSGQAIIRDAEGSAITTVQRGEFPMLGIKDRYYVILFEDAIAYVDISSNFSAPLVPITPTPTVPTATSNIPTHTPTIALTRTPRPTRTDRPTWTASPTVTNTPSNTPTPLLERMPEGNRLIVIGAVVLRDADNNRLATVREGNFPLIGIFADRFVILYEGVEAYVLDSSNNITFATPLPGTLTATPSPTASDTATATPSPTITLMPSPTPTQLPFPEDAILLSEPGRMRIYSRVVVRDADGNQLTILDEGEYSVIGVTVDAYLIPYENGYGYILMSSRNIRVRDVDLESLNN